MSDLQTVTICQEALEARIDDLARDYPGQTVVVFLRRQNEESAVHVAVLPSHEDAVEFRNSLGADEGPGAIIQPLLKEGYALFV